MLEKSEIDLQHYECLKKMVLSNFRSNLKAGEDPPLACTCKTIKMIANVMIKWQKKSDTWLADFYVTIMTTV